MCLIVKCDLLLGLHVSVQKRSFSSSVQSNKQNVCASVSAVRVDVESTLFFNVVAWIP